MKGFFKNACIDNFYQKNYELGDKIDLSYFIEDFKITNNTFSILENAIKIEDENINKKEVLASLDIIKLKINFITCSSDIYI